MKLQSPKAKRYGERLRHISCNRRRHRQHPEEFRKAADMTDDQLPRMKIEPELTVV